jgi:hypothetical protein
VGVSMVEIKKIKKNLERKRKAGRPEPKQF